MLRKKSKFLCFFSISLLADGEQIDSTRNIIVESNTHTALEIRNSSGEIVHFGLSVMNMAEEKQLIIFAPLFIFRSYLPDAIEISLAAKNAPQVVFFYIFCKKHQTDF